MGICHWLQLGWGWERERIVTREWNRKRGIKVFCKGRKTIEWMHLCFAPNKARQMETIKSSPPKQYFSQPPSPPPVSWWLAQKRWRHRWFRSEHKTTDSLCPAMAWRAAGDIPRERFPCLNQFSTWWSTSDLHFPNPKRDNQICEKAKPSFVLSGLSCIYLGGKKTEKIKMWWFPTSE